MKRTILFALGLVVAVLAVALAFPHAPAETTRVLSLGMAQHMTPNALVFSLGMGGLLGTLRSVTSDNDSYPVRDTIRQQFNKLTAWMSFINRNRLISTTTATLPVCAVATDTTKIKTTNATVVLNSGAANAVGATDPAWTLTGGNLATGYARKYLLLVSAADAFTVQASDDQASAGDCSFTALPADGLAIVGVATIANASGANFVPGTTALSGVSGLTVTLIDGHGDDSVLPFGTILPN